MDRTSRNKWLLILGCWTFLVVLFTTHDYLFTMSNGQSSHWRPELRWAISEFYTWAALTPLLVAVARCYPVDGRSALRGISVNILANAGVAFVHVFIQSFLRCVGVWGNPTTAGFLDIVANSLPAKFHANFATGAVVLCTAHAVHYYSGYRDRKARAAQLEAALANARLDALRMQINPHFLFNALNSVSALIDDDPKSAHRMLARLGDFLRLTLQPTSGLESTLDQEIQFLKSYLQIEQVRFGDRLKVAIDIDAAAAHAMVPSLILQPIVENAFRHALSKVDHGTLEISARRKRNTLELMVRDNGPGLSTKIEGVGLANTRARLETQFGQAQNLKLENAADGGLRVTIVIPFRETPES